MRSKANSVSFSRVLTLMILSVGAFFLFLSFDDDRMSKSEFIDWASSNPSFEVSKYAGNIEFGVRYVPNELSLLRNDMHSSNADNFERALNSLSEMETYVLTIHDISPSISGESKWQCTEDMIVRAIRMNVSGVEVPPTHVLVENTGYQETQRAIISFEGLVPAERHLIIHPPVSTEILEFTFDQDNISERPAIKF